MRSFACPAPSSKIFPFPSDANHLHIFRHLVPHRGAARERHERGTGCGGREGGIDEGAALADGEVVWSWCPAPSSLTEYRLKRVRNKHLVDVRRQRQGGA